MQQVSWQSLVVGRLCELKREGLGFEDAWLRALKLYPPRGRDLSPERPALFGGDEGTPLVAFFKRACEDAWLGRRPALQHFHPSLLIERDESAPAAHQRRLAA